MAMMFPANPNMIEAAYMNVMMNLLVAVDVSARPLPSDVKEMLLQLSQRLKLHSFV